MGVKNNYEGCVELCWEGVVKGDDEGEERRSVGVLAWWRWMSRIMSFVGVVDVGEWRWVRFYFTRVCFSIGGHEERSRVKIQGMSVVCHAEGGDCMARLATEHSLGVWPTISFQVAIKHTHNAS